MGESGDGGGDVGMLRRERMGGSVAVRVSR